MTKPKPSKPVSVVQVPLSKLSLPTVDMRSATDGDNVTDLIDSIRQIGIISPILVKVTKEGYEVVAGARRTRAVSQLGWDKIPAIVFPAAGIAAEVAKMHENAVRSSVSPVDEAEFLSNLATVYKLNGKELASKIGRAESYVSERLTLLKAPDELLQAVKSGELSFSSARELQRIKDPSIQASYIGIAVQSGINDTTAKQWRLDANRASNEGVPPIDPGDLQPAANVQRIKVQCALTGRTVDIEKTVLIRVCNVAWETLKADMLHE